MLVSVAALGCYDFTFVESADAGATVSRSSAARMAASPAS